MGWNSTRDSKKEREEGLKKINYYFINFSDNCFH